MSATAFSQPLLFDGTLFARPCDGARNVECAPAVVPIGTRSTLVVTLLGATDFAPKWPDSLASCAAFKFCLSPDYDRNHPICFLTKAVTLDADARAVRITLSGLGTVQMIDVLGRRPRARLVAELLGYDSDDYTVAPVFALSWPLDIANVRAYDPLEQAVANPAEDTDAIKRTLAALAALAAEVPDKDTGTLHETRGRLDALLAAVRNALY